MSGRSRINAAVEAAGPEERRVEDIRAVRGGENDDARVAVKAVHLDKNLVERLFALVVAAAHAGAALAADGIDFVNEEDRGAARLAVMNASRVREAPTPTNISTNSDAEI